MLVAAAAAAHRANRRHRQAHMTGPHSPHSHSGNTYITDLKHFGGGTCRRRIHSNLRSAGWGLEFDADERICPEPQRPRGARPGLGGRGQVQWRPPGPPLGGALGAGADARARCLLLQMQTRVVDRPNPHTVSCRRTARKAGRERGSGWPMRERGPRMPARRIWRTFAGGFLVSVAHKPKFKKHCRR